MLTNHSATNVDVNTYIQFLCAITQLFISERASTHGTIAHQC